MNKKNPVKVLFLDIETFPMESYHWGTFDQNISLNMVKQHTTMASWAAKWQGQKKIYYQDVSNQKNLRNDKKICKSLQDMINQADIIIGHAINRFDKKKSNYRFIVNGLRPTNKCKVIDTLTIAKRHFAFDSNKLEHLAEILGVPVKKYKHSLFAGFDLWKECLAGNKAAWREMKKYNPIDVIVLELVYNALIPWDNTINFNVYHKNHSHICQCGSTEVKDNGYCYQKTGKFKRFKCVGCGKPHTSKYNELSPKKRREMLK